MLNFKITNCLFLLKKHFRITILAINNKSYVGLIVFVALLFPYNAFSNECGDVYSVLAFEESSGETFFEKRSGDIIYPASLTKLMTAYLAFEAIKERNIDLGQVLDVSIRAQEISKVNKITTLNLQIGDKVSVEDAIKGSIVKSFNELSVLLAETISGNEWNFARKMNSKARELNMLSTNFRNASGLHEFGHYTTGEDLAKLVLAIKNDFPQYYHYFSLKEFQYKDKTYTSHNQVLLDYDGVEGMKTGFTSVAGYNLITVVKNDDKRIIIILTNCDSSQNRNEFTISIANQAFGIKEEVLQLAD